MNKILVEMTPTVNGVELSLPETKPTRTPRIPMETEEIDRAEFALLFAEAVMDGRTHKRVRRSKNWVPVLKKIPVSELIEGLPVPQFLHGPLEQSSANNFIVLMKRLCAQNKIDGISFAYFAGSVYTTRV